MVFKPRPPTPKLRVGGQNRQKCLNTKVFKRKKRLVPLPQNSGQEDKIAKKRVKTMVFKPRPPTPKLRVGGQNRQKTRKYGNFQTSSPYPKTQGGRTISSKNA
jgi:hypothetical protein